VEGWYSVSEYAYQNFDEEPDPSHRPMYLAKLLKHFAGAPIETVIDAGCGGGDFTEGLSEKGYKVYGLDLNESGIRAARARNNIGTFALSSVYDDLLAPFGIKQVDAVVSVETIEHLYAPRIFLSRAKDALRPGGLLAITTPYWGYLKNIALAATNKMDKALTVLWDGGHIKHFSRATLTTMVKEQGFEFVAFEGCGEGIRAYTPYLWNGMLVIFRKP
jgi:2-polyprenyl-3-methyl-5-hydroxy-6-metoxy-1,4-benzoquinol methylase